MFLSSCIGLLFVIGSLYTLIWRQILPKEETSDAQEEEEAVSRVLQAKTEAYVISHFT